jgi:hypothetical protein
MSELNVGRQYWNRTVTEKIKWKLHISRKYNYLSYTYSRDFEGKV